MISTHSSLLAPRKKRLKNNTMRCCWMREICRRKVLYQIGPTKGPPVEVDCSTVKSAIKGMNT